MILSGKPYFRHLPYQAGYQNEHYIPVHEPWADNDPDEKNHKTPILGANDGASGVGALLEIIKLWYIHNYLFVLFTCTICLIATSAGEC